MARWPPALSRGASCGETRVRGRLGGHARRAQWPVTGESEVPLKTRLIAAGIAVALATAIALAMVPGPHRAVLRPGPRADRATQVPAGCATAPHVCRTAEYCHCAIWRVPARCATAPHVCGFPDATNTGVPPRMALRAVPAQVSSGRGWRYDPRGWVQVFGNGAVLTGLSFHCNVNITASDVTISYDRIAVTGSNFGVSLRHTHDVTIENSDIYSPDATVGRLMAGIKDIYGDSSGTRVLRDNIWHTATAIRIESGLVQDNYIHSPGYVHGDHLNGVSSNGGVTALLTVRHNTIYIDHNQTDAIGLFEDFGVQANRDITGNLLAGGGYTIYGGAKAGGPAPYNIRITGNLISRRYYPRGGYYGPVARLPGRGHGNTWSGNRWLAGTGHRVAAAVRQPF